MPKKRTVTVVAPVEQQIVVSRVSVEPERVVGLDIVYYDDNRNVVSKSEATHLEVTETSTTGRIDRVYARIHARFVSAGA